LWGDPSFVLNPLRGDKWKAGGDRGHSRKGLRMTAEEKREVDAKCNNPRL